MNTTWGEKMTATSEYLIHNNTNRSATTHPILTSDVPNQTLPKRIYFANFNARY
jgi:hypothetical protein